MEFNKVGPIQPPIAISKNQLRFCNDPKCKFCALCICSHKAGSHHCGDGECLKIDCQCAGFVALQQEQI